MASITDILNASAEKYPDKIAIRYRDRVYTYSEMKKRVDGLASSLLGFGIGMHDHVALISPNSNVSLELLFATVQVGAVIEQYNIRLAQMTIGILLAKSKVKLAFVSRKVFKTASELTDVVGYPLTIVFIDDGGGDQSDDYEHLLAPAKPREMNLEGQGGDAAILLYTSGTTGIPRGVLISHDAILHQASIDIEISGITNESVQLCVLPLFHVTFLSALEAIYSGAELVILDACKGVDMASAIYDYRVTHASLIPYLLNDLIAYVEDKGIALGTLEFIIYGAEPISVQVLERAQQLFGCAFAQGYGMTETTAAITMLLPADHKNPRRLASAGRPLPGVQIRIVRGNGAECGPTEIGEIVVKTEALMLGYYLDPGRTELVIRDGWYYTGDIGYLDEGGYLYLVARKNDMVISGGENIYPQEVGICIEEMEGVVDVAVAGIPDEKWGEALAAVVVREKGSCITEADIVAHCGTRLGRFKKPRKVFFAEAIERNPSGKIIRSELRRFINARLQEEGMM